MARTLRPAIFALPALAFLTVFANRPAWAPAPVCPTCSTKIAKFTVPITGAEIVRICLVGLVTTPASAGINWESGFFDADGETLLIKHARVPKRGFRCVDTTAAELRLAGFEAESSGRLQFGLDITSTWDAIPHAPNEPEKPTLDGNTYHSMETIDVVSQATTSSHRFAHPDFFWIPL